MQTVQGNQSSVFYLFHQMLMQQQALAFIHRTFLASSALPVSWDEDRFSIYSILL